MCFASVFVGRWRHAPTSPCRSCLRCTSALSVSRKVPSTVCRSCVSRGWRLPQSACFCGLAYSSKNLLVLLIFTRYAPLSLACSINRRQTPGRPGGSYPRPSQGGVGGCCRDPGRRFGRSGRVRRRLCGWGRSVPQSRASLSFQRRGKVLLILRMQYLSVRQAGKGAFQRGTAGRTNRWPLSLKPRDLCRWRSAGLWP